LDPAALVARVLELEAEASQVTADVFFPSSFSITLHQLQNQISFFNDSAAAASAAAADERSRLEQLVADADAAVAECKQQWQADVRCLQQQADTAAAAAAAQQLSVELGLKAAIKQEQQLKANAIEACR
jgi:hypothetical protein